MIAPAAPPAQAPASGASAADSSARVSALRSALPGARPVQPFRPGPDAWKVGDDVSADPRDGGVSVTAAGSAAAAMPREVGIALTAPSIHYSRSRPEGGVGDNGLAHCIAASQRLITGRLPIQARNTREGAA